MGFGLSGSDHRSQMNNADVVVAWIDKTTGTPRAVDYRLRDFSQVVCKDTFNLTSVYVNTPPNVIDIYDNWR